MSKPRLLFFVLAGCGLLARVMQKTLLFHSVIVPHRRSTIVSLEDANQEQNQQE